MIAFNAWTCMIRTYKFHSVRPVSASNQMPYHFRNVSHPTSSTRIAMSRIPRISPTCNTVRNTAQKSLKLLVCNSPRWWKRRRSQSQLLKRYSRLAYCRTFSTVLSQSINCRSKKIALKMSRTTLC